MREKGEEESGVEDSEVAVEDIWEHVSITRSSAKIRSIDFNPSPPKHMKQLLSSLTNNTMEIYKYNTETAEPLAKVSILEMAGHRSDVRGVVTSSDGLSMASCSSEGVKLWNSSSYTCIRSSLVGYIVSIAFAPGNRYLLLGSKEGVLMVSSLVLGYLWL